MRTHEQLHTRLRRVLSSVGNSSEQLSGWDDVDTRQPKQKSRLRTKSMPLGVADFVESMNTEQLYEERSKSAEVLNHLGERSAFQLYDEEADSSSSVMDIDEYERFIDSPQVVDYQLGLRNQPPSPAMSSPRSGISPIDSHILEKPGCTPDIIKQLTASCQYARTEHDPDHGYRIVHATPVVLETPVSTISVDDTYQQVPAGTAAMDPLQSEVS